jgi:hypothetical protein
MFHERERKLFIVKPFLLNARFFVVIRRSNSSDRPLGGGEKSLGDTQG